MDPNRHIDSERSSPPNEASREKLGILEPSIHTAIGLNDAFSNERCPPQSILSLCSARVAAAALYLAAVLLKERLDWQKSIVDLMKLLNLDSSLAARKELADELHFNGDKNDTASMNIWLHKQVMVKLAENGGKVPDELRT